MKYNVMNSTPSTGLMDFGNEEQLMTSKQIAEITGKRHDNVLRDIETKLIKGAHLKVEEIFYNDTYGRAQKMYNLTFTDTMKLMVGYDAKMCSDLVDEWDRLRAEKRIPQGLVVTEHGFSIEHQIATLQELQQTKKSNLYLVNQLESQAHKVSAYDELYEVEGDNISMNRYAAMVNIGHISLNKILINMGIFQKKEEKGLDGVSKGHTPMRYYLKQGWFVIREVPCHDGKWRDMTLITPKGMLKIHGKLRKTFIEVPATIDIPSSVESIVERYTTH